MAAVEAIAHDGWAELVLNRPERRNAIDGDLAMALAGELRALDTDDAVRAILLRGADGAFCSGLDTKAFNADPPPEWLPKFNVIWRAVHTALYDCGKPIVGAFERYGINGGAALALAADLLIAGQTPSCRSARCGREWARPSTLPGCACAIRNRWQRNWR